MNNKITNKITKTKTKKNIKINRSKSKLNKNSKKIKISKLDDLMKKEIDKNIREYKKFNKDGKLLDRLEEYYLNNKSIGVMKLTIDGNKIYKDEANFKHGYLNLRSKIIENMFRFYINKINQKFEKKMNLYIYLGDNVIEESLPILYFAKCINEMGILIPDWTFYNAYKSRFSSHWENQSRIIHSQCKKYNFNNKKNIVFFQGSNTSEGHKKNKTNIREDLQKIININNNKFIKIIINKPFSSPTEWCKNKFLLDLPGAHPWSVRLKELYLSGSFIIKVDFEKEWINFYSFMFKPNENYFQIKVKNYEEENKNYAENEKVYNEINKIFKKVNNNKKLFNKMKNNNINKIKKLNTKFITEYLKYTLIEYYNNFVDL